MIRRPMDRQAANAANEQRLDKAFAAHSGQPQEAPQQSSSLAELKQLAQRSLELIAQIEQEGGGQENPDESGTPPQEVE